MMQWSLGTTSATRVGRLLCGLTLTLFAVLLYQLVLRFIFPWDFYIWSESPFMTNMMKLSTGASPFSSKFDANSFVYSPGLEYICFAILRPFNAQLDVRACRAIVILVGFTASACATGVSARLYESVCPTRPVPFALRIFAFSTISLLLFHNFTSDVCHPDNLFIFHAMAALYLLGRAVSSGRYVDALIAVSFASTGAFAKQTAVFSGVAAAAAMFFVARAIWPIWRRILLLAVAACLTASTLALLRSSEDSRFFLFDVLMLHSVNFHRVVEILRSVTRDPHRMLLLLAAAVGLCRFIGSPSSRTAPLLGCWALAGIEVLPALGGYLKAMGTWNNFTIVDVWLGVVALPGTWTLLDSPATEDAGRSVQDQRDGFLAAALLTVLCVMLLPLKIPPSKGQYAFGEALDKAISEDIRLGRRVLLPHGTTPLIHAGLTEPPQDRSNSILELRMAGLDVPETIARLEMRYYSRIYLFLSDWYGRDVLQSIERNYHEVGVIPGDRTPQFADDYLAGYGNYMRAPVRVLELNMPR